MTIRRQPDDFRVLEVLRAPATQRLAAGPGPHTVFELTKTSLTTTEAIGQLARALHIKPGQIDYAGLKDKHAVTVQHVSVPSKLIASPPPELAGRQWSARVLGGSEAPIAAGAIARNAFVITIRDLDARESRAIDERAEFLRDRDAILIPNYFGDQRFGSARHGQGFAAASLCKGDFEGALRLLVGTPARKDTGARRALTRACAERWGAWAEILEATPSCPERASIEVLAGGGDFRAAFAALPSVITQLAVDALQSAIWNATARRVAIDLGPESDRLVAADDFGELVFPRPASVSALWRALEVPMLSSGTELREPWSPFAQAALVEMDLALAELRVPGLRRPSFDTVPRPLFVRAEDVELGPPERDELASPRSPKHIKRHVAFTLPRGAYATIVLRALGQ